MNGYRGTPLTGIPWAARKEPTDEDRRKIGWEMGLRVCGEGWTFYFGIYLYLR